MPEVHRWTQADVEAALGRYRKLTGDYSATLVRTGPSQDRPFYIIVNSAQQRLDALEAYGAYAAIQALDMYCQGFQDGLAARKRP